ncbi:MAG: hypothetical protein HUK20_10980 [Fibrobacter sp.]|nr:hypothetical protein [Fibrobacter sp.]
MNYKVLVAAAALLASQSFAIIGIGAHYAPGLGTKMSAATQPEEVAKNLSLSHEGFDGVMQGFGFKLWIDILPIIDVEATLNIQFGSYDASLWVKNPVDGAETEVPLEIELGGTPFGKANPKFVAMNGDLSITYPFTSLPIIRPYIGGGLTYYLNTFVLNQKFVSGIVDGGVADMVKEFAELDPSSADQAVVKQKAEALGETLKQNVQKAALDEGLNTSIGGHILAGFRLKLPIIPIAAYANFKYYFGGDYPSEIDSGNMTAEVGVGFAL